MGQSRKKLQREDERALARLGNRQFHSSAGGSSAHAAARVAEEASPGTGQTAQLRPVPGDEEDS